MTVRENSKAAYWSVYNDLSMRRLEVLEAIKMHPGCTRYGLTHIMRRPSNVVTPRVVELLDLGLVVEGDNDPHAERPRAMLQAVQPEHYEPRKRRQTATERVKELEGAIRTHEAGILTARHEDLELWEVLGDSE